MGKETGIFFSNSEAPSTERTDCKQAVYDTKQDVFKQLRYKYGPFYVYKIEQIFHIRNICIFPKGSFEKEGKGIPMER